jgi:amidophosphoribosyltransferase
VNPFCKQISSPLNHEIFRHANELAAQDDEFEANCQPLGEMKFSEECGVFGGISYKTQIAPFIQQGLFRLQHRGQESAGICVSDKDFYLYKNQGLVMDVLTNEIISEISGKMGIGHVRYSTQGGSDNTHSQPFLVKFLGKEIAVAHNGNVKSALEMRQELELQGEIFLTNSDTEIILKKIVQELHKPPSEWTFEELGKVLTDNFTGGAWSILFFIAGKIFAFRDPFGFRPLSMCEAEEGVFVSSEDTAFQMLQTSKIIHLESGEGVEINENGYEIKRFAPKMPAKKCVFEQIYFARSDSNVFGRNVYLTRVELGKKCAEENPVDADIVVPIMESGLISAIGYSQQSGIPLHMGLIKNHCAGRSFILPEQQMRINCVKRKLTAVNEVVKGKRVVVVDDSIVRGTTSLETTRMLREAGAKEVHFRAVSPPIINTCLWGVDIPTKEELLANQYEDIDGIRDFLGLDSLAYLSMEGLKEVFGQEGWCYSCLSTGCKEQENTPSRLCECVC